MKPLPHTVRDPSSLPDGGAQGAANRLVNEVALREAQGAAHRFAQELNRARYRTSQPEQLLGEGGIGRVIIAEETLLRRPVAMKTLRDDRAGELYEARLIREARITGLLEHPSIVPVHDIGRNEDGNIYYTMKKVIGLTLREVIEHLRPATGDTTDEAKALRESVQERFGSIPARLGLFQKVCDAIAFAHAHPLRVIHRDLKPENIMVGEFGEVLVMDWGLAKVLATDEAALSEVLPLESGDQVSPAGFTVSRIALSTAGQFVGTPMYAAPEQLEGRLEDIDEKSDVYALGGVLYHLLTLEAPISSDPSMSAEDKSPDIATQTATDPGSAPDWDTLLKFIRDGNVVPLLHKSTGSKSIPEALRPLLQRALAPDRSQRIASVSALQQAISQFLAGYANAFEQAGAWKHFGYFVKRHKGVALSSGAALIVIASLVAGFTRRVTLEKERAQAEAERASKAETETSKQLMETNRQLERSQLEEGRTWLERARAAWKNGNGGDPLSAIMLAGRAVGYQGYGRRAVEAQEFEDAYPLLLAKPMENATAEAERLVEVKAVTEFIDTITPTYLPLWSSPYTAHQEGFATWVAFSPDGSYLASGFADDKIKIWDSTTGKELHRLGHYLDRMWCGSFAPQSSHLASASHGTITLWDAATGNELGNIQGDDSLSFTSVDFSPDRKYLAASNDKTIKILDAASGKVFRSLAGHLDQIVCVRFSPDGRLLASASGATIKIWDAATGGELRTLQAHDEVVNSVAFSPDGWCLASASADHTIKIWDAIGGIELHAPTEHTKYVNKSSRSLQGHTGSVRCVAFSQDGRLASASNDNTIKIWDATTGKQLCSIEGHVSSVTSVAFSPDGRRLASISLDGTVKMWDAATSKELRSLKGHRREVTRVVFSVDGNRLASASADDTIKIWDAATGKELFSLKEHRSYLISVAFSRDGNRLAGASADDTIKIWDATTGKELHNLTAHKSANCRINFFQDGSRLANISIEGTVKKLDAATSKELHSFTGHGSELNLMAFSPDGSRLVSVSSGWIRLWDLAIGKEITKPSFEQLETMVAWFGGNANSTSPDGMLVARKEDSTIRLFIAHPEALDLAGRLRLGLVRLEGRGVVLPSGSPSFVRSDESLLPIRRDSLGILASPAIAPDERSMLKMQFMAETEQFRSAKELWQALPDQAPNSPIRRLYLLALIDATKHPQIHGHPTICQTAAQIAPVLTKEMMALPTISLAMMSLMQALAKDETAEMEAPRAALSEKLKEVASSKWLKALQDSTAKK